MHASVFPNFTVDGPLVPSSDQWPVFDSVLMCSFSPAPSLSSSPSVIDDSLPSPADLAAMPIPPSRSPPRNKNPGHIPRPRNAFMLFRSAFAAAQKVSSTIEHDNRHITRIIAHCWNRLSDAEKQVWRDKAAAEKLQHAERYPNYRFSPVGRANRPVKRNVRRNGLEDVKRCEKLAELVMAGKSGQELKDAIKKIDDARLTAAHSADDTPDASPSSNGHTEMIASQDTEPTASGGDVPPFRSPLLPPTNISLLEESLFSRPLTRARAPVPPTLHSDLEFLLQLPSYQHAHAPDNLPSPAGMRFVEGGFAELEQSAPDYSALFSWNQSDNFSYYH